MALLKVFTLCDGQDNAGLSILVQVDSSLKKYIGLVQLTFSGEALLKEAPKTF